MRVVGPEGVAVGAEPWGRVRHAQGRARDRELVAAGGWGGRGGEGQERDHVEEGVQGRRQSEADRRLAPSEPVSGPYGLTQAIHCPRIRRSA